MSPQVFNIMLYKDYLNTERWRETRRRIIRQKKVCEICEANTNFNVHHKSYRNGSQKYILGKEPDGLLVLLCQDCHYLWHEIYGKIKMRASKIKNIKFHLSYGLPKRTAFLNCLTHKKQKI